MKVLDFSNNQFDALNPKIEWQNNLSEFLKDWHSNSDFITAHTSGSTGKPKPIKLPKSAMKMSAQLTGEYFDLQKGNKALLCLPVNFIAGKMMVVRAIELGLKLYCVEPKSQINLKSIPKLDFVPMTPMQVQHSLDSILKIKKLLIGGAALSDDLRELLISKKMDAYESYGMTETITHIALKKISEPYFTCLNGVEISKDERDCLVIQTPYFDKEITTNDLVEIKKDNQFKWLGRIDNVINSGGIKLIPEQLEAKLKPYLNREFIFGSQSDTLLGEKLVLIIEGPLFDIQLPKDVLQKFEKPKEIYFLDKFPRTENGKIQRGEILKLI